MKGMAVVTEHNDEEDAVHKQVHHVLQQAALTLIAAIRAPAYWVERVAVVAEHN
jgi:hypothetical protein